MSPLRPAQAQYVAETSPGFAFFSPDANICGGFADLPGDICWSDVDEHSPERRPDGTAIKDRYMISGVTYCVAPIAELNGNASITLSELQFSGHLRWEK